MTAQTRLTEAHAALRLLGASSATGIAATAESRALLAVIRETAKAIRTAGGTPNHGVAL